METLIEMQTNMQTELQHMCTIIVVLFQILSQTDLDSWVYI